MGTNPALVVRVAVHRMEECRLQVATDPPMNRLTGCAAQRFPQKELEAFC